MSTPTINWNDDYSTGYVETDDPRIVAIIERDDDALAPDGDAYAPAYFLDGSHGWRYDQAGSTFTDDFVMDRIIEARQRRVGRNFDGLERYARIFLDTTFELVSSHVHRDYQVLILNTPAWREHVGLEDNDPQGWKPMIDGDAATWQHYLDGEVYGIGYATFPGRVTTETPIDLNDWDIEMECWGFYGEDYAAEEALASLPELDPMLPLGD